VGPAASFWPFGFGERESDCRVVSLEGGEGGIRHTIDPIEGDKELVCSPYLGEGAQDTRLKASVPDELFVGDSVAVVHSSSIPSVSVFRSSSLVWKRCTSYEQANAPRSTLRDHRGRTREETSPAIWSWIPRTLLRGRRGRHS
jgi:hypothetical protein